MTTRVLNPHSCDTGELLRIVHGEPVVRWDGDRTEYPTTWRRIDVVSSDDYLLPEGRFDEELWVSANDDVWRRRVMPTAYPCEPGFEHRIGTRQHDGAQVCWYCDQPETALEPVEFFVLVSAEGFPADGCRPQERAEVEAFAGELMRVGSVEARERAKASSPTPGPGGGCFFNPMTVAVMVLACLVVGVAGRILFGLLFE